MSIRGLSAINEEQKDLIRTLLDKSIELVVVKGGLGSGKTIVVLAYALEQCELYNFDDIIITRPMVPDRGEEIGFLPGTELEKLDPYLGCFQGAALELNKIKEGAVKSFAKFSKPKSLATIKGMSFSNSILIMDETQDATKSQIKKFIGRAGRGSKVILIGDKHQKSDSKNEGLEWLTDNMKKIEPAFAKIVILKECVRSNVAAFADKLRS